MKKKLFQIFQNLEKSELLKYLKSSFDEMDDKQRRAVYLELYDEKEDNNNSFEELYLEVESFHRQSINGVYYEPFNINSKNFMDVSTKTSEWFEKLSYFLDKTSNLVNKKAFKDANECFEKLYDLINRMENGEEMIFAHEYGTWMITTKSDYDNAYIYSLSQTENASNFTKRVLPLLERDSNESLSSKIYSKVKKAANPQQLNKVVAAIKLKQIRIK